MIDNETLDRYIAHYVKEAEQYLESYHDIDPYKEIFEAYEPTTKMEIEQNEKSKTGIMGSLQKALQALIRLIRNIKSALTNFIDKRKMGEKEREAYDTFQEEMKKHPELRNKKVTVRDYRRVQAEYENILREADATERRLAAGEPVDITKITDRMANFTREFSKSAVASVTAEAAIGVAGTSREWARTLLATIENNERVYNSLVSAMGEKETKKLKKKLNSLTKRISLQRQIMRMKGTLTSDITKSLNNTATDLLSLCANGKNLTDKDVQKDKKAFLASGMEVIRNGDMVKRIMGNKTVRDESIKGVKTGLKYKKKVKNEIKQQKKEIKAKQKEDNRRQKALRKGKFHEQSMKDSILGTYSNGKRLGDTKAGKLINHAMDFF